MTEPADDPRALTARALQQARAGRHPAALATLDRAVAAAPGSVEPRYLRGLLRLESGDADGGIDDLTAALALSPAAAPIAAALGSARLRAGDAAGADRALRRALLLLPAQPDALAGLAGCRVAGLRFADGLRAADRALLLAPGHPQALGNRAEALHHLGRHDEALASLADLAAAGGPQVRLNRAVGLLSLERWTDGWPAYEARLDPAIPDHIRRRHGLPRWSPAPAGRPVAVLAEQGVGEQILFLRFVPALAERAPIAAVELDAKLHPLVARSLPALPLVAARRFRDARGPVADERAVAASGADCAIEIASLPAALGDLSPADAAAAPYLAADPDRAAALRGALAVPGRRLVGVCWRSKNAAFGGFKSTRLIDWAPILTAAGATFVNLQYGDVTAEIDEAERATGTRVRTADVDLFDDLDGAAALAAAMDLVITTGSTTAQLSGALGIPTWVLLSRGPGLMWYWGHGDRTPWYPAMRLFRQQMPGDWGQPVAEAAAALAATP
ncbi:hypothetical protein GCM10017083_54390 [Thalassobaculum fulvum]|uniref:Tetratricopeptide repeat protein n=1 Tax=Thalassobaculum fulvum TaxID=1633335 RepID=A0A918XYM6_9PROT|nr:tetratricopeptide repeat protein [Thalassobaculum fulvum]GHD63705.1 hypothetical protein GCM10017083_54390 [Thalassobaculum fulvum]